MTEAHGRSRGRRSSARRTAGPPEEQPAASAPAAVTFTEPTPPPPTGTGPTSSAAPVTSRGAGSAGSNRSSGRGRSDGGAENEGPDLSGGSEQSSASHQQGDSHQGNTDTGRRGGRSRNGRGRGKGRSGDSSTAEYGGVKTMQGADMTVRLPEPPKAKKGALRVMALGGISEIGRNMTVFEHNSRLLLIDCGVLFPSSTEPGVDLILPDFGPIEDRLDAVEALVLTHAHEDHIGAIPFLLQLRPDIPVVGSRFTLALVAAKCREHRIKPKFVEVDQSDTSRFGAFEVEYFAVNHSIPDALGIVLTAGGQSVMHTGDIKLDQLPPDKRPTDLPKMSRFGDRGIDLLLLDSTNATTPGVSPSENGISRALERLILDARKLVVVACFASNVYRVQGIVDAAAAAGRKVALTGRSMMRNMEIATEMGFLTDDSRVIVDMDTAAKLPPGKLVVVTTGTQGEAMAGLSRMARREHRQFNLTEGDRVIFSSSLVPGNEEAVFGVMNGLSQMGVEVVTNRDANIHVSGHGFSGELLFVYNAVRPRNAMPVHGEWRHLRANKALAIATGIPEKNVVLAQNGVVVDLVDHKASVVGQVAVGNLYVDGLSTGDVGDTVLADRATLGEGGFIAATVVVDPRTGRPVGKPQLIGKGFTDEPGALAPAVDLVENTLLDLAGEGETDPYRIAQAVRRTVGRWVADKWRRKPMIVPTVITSAVVEA